MGGSLKGPVYVRASDDSGAVVECRDEFVAVSACGKTRSFSSEKDASAWLMKNARDERRPA